MSDKILAPVEPVCENPDYYITVGAALKISDGVREVVGTIVDVVNVEKGESNYRIAFEESPDLGDVEVFGHAGFVRYGYSGPFKTLTANEPENVEVITP